MCYTINILNTMCDYDSVNNNSPFTPQTRMADVIHTNYYLIPEINRFGISYGFGNKTVREVCEQNGINVSFFLSVINSSHNQNYLPDESLQDFSILLIVEYLKRTHVDYMSKQIPEIEGLIASMEEQLTQEGARNVKLLSGFFKNYKSELEKHLYVEDNEVFPYAIALEKAVERKPYDNELLQRVKEEPGSTFEHKHSTLEVTLSDLKNLIIRHLPPVACRDLCQNLLMALFGLEKDFLKHTRIEDRVLLPRVRQLEKIVLEDNA